VFPRSLLTRTIDFAFQEQQETPYLKLVLSLGNSISGNTNAPVVKAWPQGNGIYRRERGVTATSSTTREGASLDRAIGLTAPRLSSRQTPFRVAPPSSRRSQRFHPSLPGVGAVEDLGEDQGFLGASPQVAGEHQDIRALVPRLLDS
jgi:hypothetical protein